LTESYSSQTPENTESPNSAISQKPFYETRFFKFGGITLFSLAYVVIVNFDFSSLGSNDKVDATATRVTVVAPNGTEEVLSEGYKIKVESLNPSEESITVEMGEGDLDDNRTKRAWEVNQLSQPHLEIEILEPPKSDIRSQDFPELNKKEKD